LPPFPGGRWLTGLRWSNGPATPGQRAERIRAGREAALAAGLPDFFINARTDDVVARSEWYAEAGADGLFVPGLLDLDVLSAITSAVTLPVNAMAGPGGPS
jgi:2-methylisocitrate lyase-like PEP mutase family enzyme